MKRLLMAAAAAVVLGGCGDSGSNPALANPGTPALNGSGSPNLYVSGIFPERDANGVLKVRIRICNNGSASAGTSTTYLEHWFGFYFESYDIYTTNLAMGMCTLTTSPSLIDSSGSGYTHSYYVWADEFQVVTESNENDNHGRLEGVY